MNTKAASFLLALAVISQASAADTPPQRPMDQMHGDCSAFAWNMSQEFTLWNGQPAAARASAEVDAVPTIPVSQRVDLALHPHPQVRFVTQPETDRGGPNKYSGLAAFKVDRAGLYRISASSGLWIDVVVDGKRVPSSAFEMQTECKSVFKSVAYTLPANARLIVQLNGSATPNTTIAITPWTN